MKRYLYFIYGVTGHVAFLLLYAYLAGFLGNVLVPKSIDSGTTGPIGESVVIDLLLLVAFSPAIRSWPDRSRRCEPNRAEPSSAARTCGSRISSWRC